MNVHAQKESPVIDAPKPSNPAWIGFRWGALFSGPLLVLDATGLIDAGRLRLPNKQILGRRAG
jgi:hypothetical protein